MWLGLVCRHCAVYSLPDFMSFSPSALDGGVRFYSLKTGAETAVIRVPGTSIHQTAYVNAQHPPHTEFQARAARPVTYDAPTLRLDCRCCRCIKLPAGVTDSADSGAVVCACGDGVLRAFATPSRTTLWMVRVNDGAGSSGDHQHGGGTPVCGLHGCVHM